MSRFLTSALHLPGGNNLLELTMESQRSCTKMKRFCCFRQTMAIIDWLAKKIGIRLTLSHNFLSYLSYHKMLAFEDVFAPIFAQFKKVIRKSYGKRGGKDGNVP
jgi:hypothetical protein